MIDINKYINEKLDLDIWDYYYVDDNTFVEYITLTTITTMAKQDTL